LPTISRPEEEGATPPPPLENAGATPENDNDNADEILRNDQPVDTTARDPAGGGLSKEEFLRAHPKKAHKDVKAPVKPSVPEKKLAKAVEPTKPVQKVEPPKSAKPEVKKVEAPKPVDKPVSSAKAKPIESEERKAELAKAD